MKISIKKALRGYDNDRWDEFVLRHSIASPYHLIGWKKAVEDAYNHKCYYLYAEKSNEIVGILPLIQLRLFPFVNEMVTLPFCDVGNSISIDAESQDALYKEAIRLSTKIRANKIQLRGEPIPTNNFQSFLQVIDTKKIRMFLDLPSSSEELFKSFKSKLRSQVRKAEKNNVVFEWGGLNDINEWYYVFSKNMHELGSPVHSKVFLKAVLKNYGARSKLGIVKVDEHIIGMGIILLGGKCVSIPWASTLREYNHLAPNMLLYWNFLKYSADNGFTCFDFGRSTEGEGTYKFKKQWGARPSPLVWYEYTKSRIKNDQSFSLKLIKRTSMASIWKRLPLNFVNIVGPYIRRYISL